jgi:hypothetical protein
MDFSVRARPFLSIPFGEADKDAGTGSDLYSLGGGGEAFFDVDISSLLSNPLNIGYSVSPLFLFNAVPVKNTETSLSLLAGGLGVSLFYQVNRLNLRGGVEAGLYQGSYQNGGRSGGNTANTWAGFSAEAGFRFSPRFVLSAHGGYRRYNYLPGNPLYTGIFAGLTLQFSFETGDNDDGVGVEFRQDEPVFPVFLALYQSNRAGVLKISNRESAEIRNVQVYFTAGNYTASQMLCGTVNTIGKNRSAEIPLYADFSPALLSLTENGQIPGEVLVRYELLGSPRDSVHQALVQVFNRNSYRWNDPASLAVFISSTDPEVLDYARYAAGIARNHLRSGLNQNMQFAAYLFEGLRMGNISLAQNDQTPYRTFHLDSRTVDHVQFPFQTLAYRGGDVDDLGLLYAASLEALGIPSALIPLPDDFVVAFSLGIGEEDAPNFFNDLDSVLIIDGEVWMPVALSAIREGFINCWYNAVNSLNSAFETGANVDMVILSNAWTNYPPAAVGSQESQFEKPDENTLFRVVETDMLRYIASEFGPKIQAMTDEIRRLGPSAARYNRLGLLYTRSGMLAEASAEYQRAAALGSVAAMVNLGNLAMMNRNFAVAEQWYNQALRIEPDNRAARNGLNRIADRDLD